MSKYNQIYTDLLAEISAERLGKGARLPSETELMDSYQASRGTVRKAIELLQERGFVQKLHGKGAFVLSQSHIELQLGGIVSFQEIHRRLGRSFTTEVVEFRRFPLQGPLLEHLRAAEGSLITQVKRVRHINGERVILDVNHFVEELIPGLSAEIAKGSIYEYIEGQLALNISFAQRVIEAQRCNEDDRRYLDLGGQDHVIVIKNHTFLQDGRQFEYTESRHTLDKFYFSDVARR